MSRSLTLLDSGVIDARSIDRILQAVIFFADSVAIRATYEPARTGSSSDARALRHHVDSLHEQGLIKFWAHEYEVDDGGTTIPSRPSAIRRQADLVIVRSHMSHRIGEMDELMRRIREEAYGDRLDARPRLRQGTAEIVGLRNQLASLVISSELNQDGMLSNPALRAALSRNFRGGQGGSFESAVVAELVGQLHLGPLTDLTPEQVEESRRYVSGFRHVLDESLLAVAHGVDPELTPTAIAREIVSRYRTIMSEIARPRHGAQLTEDVVWDVIGATVPGSIMLKYGISALRWRREVAGVRPFLLLMQLDRALGEGGHGRRLGSGGPVPALE
ncbi:hypothetical protein ABZ235_01480 [Streptomyces canus]|uniref:hypothetical protein n=1 Tax=Streptomyces canus TaxID=58343 RepID=UPI0033ACC1B6